jgi:hypothetical protein
VCFHLQQQLKLAVATGYGMVDCQHLWLCVVLGLQAAGVASSTIA